MTNIIIPAKTKFDASVIRSLTAGAVLNIGTWWEVEHFRAGKKIDEWANGNVTTTEGLNAFLNIMFHDIAKKAKWYITIFEDNYTPLVGNTYAAPGFTECTAYTEATRPEYVTVDATALVMTNTASKATFTINGTKTIYGAALVGGDAANTSAKSDTGTAGAVLFASSKFSLSKSVVATDVLLVTCSITLADV